MIKPSITEYTKLLHCHGVESEVAKKYKERHAHQDPFLKRAKVMDQVFKIEDPHRSTDDAPGDSSQGSAQ